MKIEPWNAGREIARASWSPPDGLRVETLAEIGDLQRLPLMSVVDFLAFGQTRSPDGLDVLQDIAARAQAARALFSAAQNGSVELSERIGTEAAPKKLDPAVFDVPHSLVSGDDTAIEPDLNAVSMERFAELRAAQDAARRDNKSPPSRWSDIHVERASLSNWLRNCVGVNVGALPPRPNLEAILREAIIKNGRPLRTQDAEKIASAAGAQENQKKVREMLKSIQGPQKSGPRGPRKPPG